MTKGINVIKHYGRPMEAISLSGERIYREDRIFVSSHQTWYETMPYDNHFVYHTKRIGTSLLCTCGSPAIVVDYGTYKKYSSYRGQLIVCQTQIQTGKHADRST